MVHKRLTVLGLVLALGLGLTWVSVPAADAGGLDPNHGPGMSPGSGWDGGYGPGMGPSSGWDGGGHPGWGPGYPGHWDDPAYIFRGEPFSLTGLVSTSDYYGHHGGAIALDTGSEEVVIHGLGPFWYWEELGATYPAEGEAVTVDGYGVDFAGYTSLIAVSLTKADGTFIQLRDPDSGWPLWTPAGWR